VAKSGDKTFKSARIDVNYDNSVLTARGEAETALPGISKGTIEVITGKGQTSVVADFIIGDSISGVKGGNLHFLFKKDAEGSISSKQALRSTQSFRVSRTLS
jgi:hypothetical protein